MKINYLYLFVFYFIIILIAIIIYPTRLDVAKMYIKSQKLNLATNIIEKLLASSKDDFFVIKESADFQEKLGNLNDSINLYERLILQTKNNKKYIKKLIDLYKWSNQALKSTVYKEKLFNLEKNNKILLKEIINDYQWFQNYNKVIFYQKKLVEFEPKNIKYRAVLAQYYFDNNMKEKCITQYNIIEKQSKNKSLWYLKKGDVYFVLKNYNKALIEYTKFLKEKPNNIDVLKKIISIKIFNKDYDFVFSKIKQLWKNKNLNIKEYCIDIAGYIGESDWAGNRLIELYKQTGKLKYVLRSIEFYKWKNNIDKTIFAYNLYNRKRKLNLNQMTDYINYLTQQNNISKIFKFLKLNIKNKFLYNYKIVPAVTNFYMEQKRYKLAEKYIYKSFVFQKYQDKFQYLFKEMNYLLFAINAENLKLKYYNVYLKKFPDDITIRKKIINYYIEQNKYNNAILEYKKLLKYTKNISDYKELEFIFRITKNIKELKSLYNIMIVKFPKKKNLYVEKYNKLEFYNLTENELKKLLWKKIKTNPYNEYYYSLLLKIYKNNKLKKKYILENKVKYKIYNESDIFQLAELYKADKEYYKLIKILKNSYFIHNKIYKNQLLLFAYKKINKKTEYYHYLKIIYKLQPENINNAIELAKHYKEQKYIFKYKKILNNLKKYYKNDFDKMFYIAQNYSWINDYKTAISIYKLIEKNKFTKKLLKNIADCYLWSNDNANALKYYVKLLKYNKTDFKLNKLIGQIYLWSSDYYKSKKYFDYAYTLNSNDFELNFYLAELYFTIKNNLYRKYYYKAEKLYSKVKKTINNKIIYSKILSQLGYKQKAELYLKKLYNKYPDNKEIKRSYIELLLNQKKYYSAEYILKENRLLSSSY